jgi:hypothetical protein
MALIHFLASVSGRWVRVIAGVVLIVLGLAVVGDSAGIVIAVVGLVPLIAGAADFCVFAPLFGAPLSGRQIRLRSGQR